MNCSTMIDCRLYIDSKYYQKLNETGQELFQQDELSGLYFSDFPGDYCNGHSIYDCIIAYCEVTLITLNDVYDITDDVEIDSEVFTMGRSDHHFSLVSHMTYLGVEKPCQELMTFEIVEQTPHRFHFKLLGDQTMFAME